MTQRPKYRAYTVIKRDGKDDYWLPIGSAFEHGDGDGLDIRLQALPIDGRIVLRVPKTDEQRDQQRERTGFSRSNNQQQQRSTRPVRERQWGR